jgi:hypothetical protein
MLGAGLPAHHSMFLKRSQLFDQHLLRDAGNALLQLASALRAIQQHIKNNNLPAPGDNIQMGAMTMRFFNGTVPPSN